LGGRLPSFRASYEQWPNQYPNPLSRQRVFQQPALRVAARMTIVLKKAMPGWLIHGRTWTEPTRP
jgi:hypothetical protein